MNECQSVHVLDPPDSGTAHQSKTWPLFFLILIFSVLWPYLKLILSLLLVLAPWLLKKRVAEALSTLDSLGKMSLVDIYVIIMFIIAFKASSQSYIPRHSPTEPLLRRSKSQTHAWCLCFFGWRGWVFDYVPYCARRSSKRSRYDKQGIECP